MGSRCAHSRAVRAAPGASKAAAKGTPRPSSSGRSSAAAAPATGGGNSARCEREHGRTRERVHKASTRGEAANERAYQGAEGCGREGQQLQRAPRAAAQHAARQAERKTRGGLAAEGTLRVSTQREQAEMLAGGARLLQRPRPVRRGVAARGGQRRAASCVRRSRASGCKRSCRAGAAPRHAAGSPAPHAPARRPSASRRRAAASPCGGSRRRRRAQQGQSSQRGAKRCAACHARTAAEQRTRRMPRIASIMPRTSAVRAAGAAASSAKGAGRRRLSSTLRAMRRAAAQPRSRAGAAGGAQRGEWSGRTDEVEPPASERERVRGAKRCAVRLGTGAPLGTTHGACGHAVREHATASGHYSRRRTARAHATTRSARRHAQHPTHSGARPQVPTSLLTPAACIRGGTCAWLPPPCCSRAARR
jgi:hypothetical protein